MFAHMVAAVQYTSNLVETMHCKASNVRIFERKADHSSEDRVAHLHASSKMLTLVGSLISAANLPQGRCLTPLYLTAPLALTPLTALETAPLLGLLMPEEAECILCMWLGFGDLPLSCFLSCKAALGAELPKGKLSPFCRTSKEYECTEALHWTQTLQALCYVSLAVVCSFCSKAAKHCVSIRLGA